MAEIVTFNEFRKVPPSDKPGWAETRVFGYFGHLRVATIKSPGLEPQSVALAILGGHGLVGTATPWIDNTPQNNAYIESVGPLIIQALEFVAADFAANGGSAA